MDYTDLVKLDYESVFLCFCARVYVCTYKSVYVCEFVCLCVCFYLSVCARARVLCKRKYGGGPPNLRGPPPPPPPKHLDPDKIWGGGRGAKLGYPSHILSGPRRVWGGPLLIYGGSPQILPRLWKIFVGGRPNMTEGLQICPSDLNQPTCYILNPAGSPPPPFPHPRPGSHAAS